MENRKKIDDLFKSELGNYTETPPPAVWDSLEKKLDHIPSWKPAGLFKWFGFVAALCVLITMSVLVARNIDSNRETAANNTPATNNTTAQNTPAPGNTTNNTAPLSGEVKGTKPESAENGADHLTHDGDVTAVDRTEDNVTNTPVDKTAEKNTLPTANKQGKNSSPTNTVTQRNKRNHNEESKHERTGKQELATASMTSKKTTEPGNKANGTRPQEEETEQPINTYSSSSGPPNNTDAATTNNSIDSTETAHEDADRNTTNKNDLSTSTPPPPPPPSTPKSKFRRFEAGIKGGYEQSGTNDAAKTAIASPYVQYKITRKLAVMLQPAVKYATVSSRQVSKNANYYRVNDAGTSTLLDSIGTDILDDSGVVVDVLYTWRYKYTQSHDSIVKSNWTGGKYVEFEMPVLIKYYLANNFSIYGGVNMVYSKLTGLTEHTYIEKDMTRTAVQQTMGHPPAPVPPKPDFIYSGSEYSAYNGPQYPAPAGSMFRFGYMFGFSYEYEKRWLFDLLLQQTFIKPNVQGGYNTYTPLSAPYLRLTIGYKLTK